MLAKNFVPKATVRLEDDEKCCFGSTVGILNQMER